MSDNRMTGSIERLWVNGIEVPWRVESFEIVTKPTAAFEELARVEQELKPCLGRVSGSMTMQMDPAWRELERILPVPPLPRGADPWTLLRRALYGGRKGRSAFRRLRTLGWFAVTRAEP